MNLCLDELQKLELLLVNSALCLTCTMVYAVFTQHAEDFLLIDPVSIWSVDSTAYHSVQTSSRGAHVFAEF